MIVYVNYGSATRHSMGAATMAAAMAAAMAATMAATMAARAEDLEGFFSLSLSDPPIPFGGWSPRRLSPPGSLQFVLQSPESSSPVSERGQFESNAGGDHENGTNERRRRRRRVFCSPGKATFAEKRGRENREDSFGGKGFFFVGKDTTLPTS